MTLSNALRLLCGAAGLAAAAACASSNTQLTRRDECRDPDTQLSQIIAAYDRQSAPGCWGSSTGTPADCDALRRDVQRLAIVCPNHIPTLMTNAVMAYEAGMGPVAQQYLDRIFERPGSQPDAAVLRGHIAIEQGNLPFARRFLANQIALAPGHAGLHETYAGVLYLAQELDEARRELARAESLGAPRWRIAYHQGLVEEASGDREAAGKLYQEALEKNPGWEPAQTRLKAMAVPRLDNGER